MPIIESAEGIAVTFGQPKRILVAGKRIGRLHYQIVDNLDGTKTGHCLDCHRAIDFAGDTPWAEMEAEMAKHLEKFCLGRIE